MTKVLVGIAVAVVGLGLVPGAAAHGAPPVRDLDTRVLLDDDGPLGFGACVEGVCPGPTGQGLDLLALDVREASLLDGAPALVFRFVLQTEGDLAGKSLQLSLAAAGASKDFALTTTDGTAWTSTAFERVDPAVD